MKKNILKIAALSAVAAVAANASTEVDANSQGFGTLYNQFGIWLTGNLGKLLALLGFVGTVIVYMMTHKGSILIIGIIISLIVGGAPGIADIFFRAGQGSFNENLPSEAVAG